MPFKVNKEAFPPPPSPPPFFTNAIYRNLDLSGYVPMSMTPSPPQDRPSFIYDLYAVSVKYTLMRSTIALLILYLLNL